MKSLFHMATLKYVFKNYHILSKSPFHPKLSIYIFIIIFNTQCSSTCSLSFTGYFIYFLCSDIEEPANITEMVKYKNSGFCNFHSLSKAGTIL